tara:strand:+ start:599 stop:784 length:186 start_codon:yes stop_codon:yes gene_type:complete
MEKQVMKLTKQQIKQIIKEELDTVMREIEAEPVEATDGFSDADMETAEEELIRKLQEPAHV